MKDILDLLEIELPEIATTLVAVITTVSILWTKFINPKLKSIKRGTLRNELLELMRTKPSLIDDNIKVGVEERYLQYHELGGNSYIDNLFREFSDKYISK